MMGAGYGQRHLPQPIHRQRQPRPPLTDEDELRSNGVVHNHRNVYTEPMHLNTELRARDTFGLFPRIR